MTTTTAMTTMTTTAMTTTTMAMMTMTTPPRPHQLMMTIH
jgi:hypothetical protein